MSNIMRKIVKNKEGASQKELIDKLSKESCSLENIIGKIDLIYPDR